MEVQIDLNALENTIRGNLDRAVSNAVNSWQLQNAIAETISSELVAEPLKAAVREAIKNVNMSNLVATITHNLESAFVRTVTRILAEGLTEVICKLRNVQDYTPDGKAERERIYAELTRE